MFALLTLYSVFILSSLDRSANVAYARTISANQEFAGQHHFVIVDNALARGIFERAIDRLSMRRNDAQELCAVSEEEFASLSILPGTEVEEFTVDNETLFVATPDDGHALAHDELRSIVHCQAVEIFDRIIMMLSAHVS